MTVAYLSTQESIVRVALFTAAFGALAVLELMVPRRRLERGRWSRWPANLALMLIYTALTRLAAPLATVGVAIWAAERGLGLFNILAAPAWLEVGVAVVLLDAAIWGQHVAFHHIPWFWRLHRVHHSDVGFDVTTGVRFHPGEVLLSLAIKAAVVVALGAPPLAALVFELLLSVGSLFTHANLRLPEGLDRFLRRLIVTPDMHRVHHSTIRDETDSNYGFSLSVWDRLFRTYRQDAAAGQEGVVFGLTDFRQPGDNRLDRLLIQPLQRRPPPARRPPD
jgi:sterol desaturase/sphingolipid hydroxylase (fatty acid hydroxylase superfamily)